jgi:monofunctional chorismate mutase
MNNLDEARIKINEIDKQLIDLFKKRMELSKEIGLYKFDNNLPILDEAREELLKKKDLILLDDKNLEKYYLMFLEGVLNSSKEYQKDIINEKIRTNR